MNNINDVVQLERSNRMKLNNPSFRLDVHKKQTQATPWNKGLKLGPLSEETKRKLSMALSGSNNVNYGKKIPEHLLRVLRLPKTDIAKKRMSDAKKNNPEFISKLIERNKGNAGKHHTYDHRVKISEACLGGHWYGNVRYIETRVYCEKFNIGFKERVRAYWGYKCVECGKPQTTKKLDIHHVHYDKKMCCNGSPRDVVPLCKACHNSTNRDREYWEDRFTKLIYDENQGGKCFFTKEEFIEYKRDAGDLN